jgi:predicted amidophosphoribosyltransferase
LKLNELKNVLWEQRLATIISQIERGQPQAAESISPSEFQKIPAKKRTVVAHAFYLQAKSSLGHGNFRSALPLMHSAHNLEPQSSFYIERLALLQKALERRIAFDNKMTLMDMQRGLGLVCVRKTCQCDTLFLIAKCRGAIEEGFHQERMVGNVPVYTVGPYYAHVPHGKWTHFLKQVKHQFNRDLVEPLAEILATFILQETPLMASADILVPIPPSTAKFGDRGFAPNDMVAAYLRTHLALPVCNAFRRKCGVPTREATDEELAAQYEVQNSAGEGLRELSVLLLEDIWTTGRTIAICADKLRSYGPKEILAVALGKTS